MRSPTVSSEVHNVTVSVVIPNYNAAVFVEQAVRSVLADGAVLEVVIVDNASTDGSRAVLEAIDDPRVQLVCSPENLGASRGRALGASIAVSDLLCFLDADDHLSAGAVSAGAAAIAAFDLDMSLFEMVRVAEDGSGVRPFLRPPTAPITGHEAFSLSLGTWRIHPMGVMRRVVYERAMEVVSLHGYSDDELVTRHLFLAARRVGGNAGIYHYRVVKKPADARRVIGQGRTALAVLALAIESLDGATHPRPVHAARNLLVRLMFELAVRGLGSAACAEAARSLRAEYRHAGVGWRPADAAYGAMSAITPVLLSLGRR